MMLGDVSESADESLINELNENDKRDNVEDLPSVPTVSPSIPQRIQSTNQKIAVLE